MPKIIMLFIAFIAFNYPVNATEIQKTDSNKQVLNNNNNKLQTQDTFKSKFVYFIKNFWAPDENPAFGQHKHMIGVTYGYDYDRLHHRDTLGRNLNHISVQYSAPFKFFNVNGRYSFGIFTLFGKDHAALNEKNGTYKQWGIEFIPEIILGFKHFYITAGVGASYMVGTKEVSYLSKHKASSNGIPTTIGLATGEQENQQYHYDGMTYFNFALTASIGHRFNNGLVIELLWKHYSNGGLGAVNYDVNAFGASLRYAFSI